MQLKSALGPSDNLFRHLHLHHPPAIFVDSDIDILKFFEIDRLLNKQTIKRDRGLSVKYLVC